MRTTLTLDEDVAILVERVRQRRGLTLKVVINQALRSGLESIDKPSRQRRPHLTQPVSAGRCLIGDISNVAEALAIGEGEDFK